MNIKTLILFIVVVIVATIGMSYTAMLTGMFAYNPDAAENETFKIGTFAVCGERDGYPYCEDRVFASCNGELIEVTGETVECNGKVYPVENKSLAKGYMDKNWSDPRPPDFVTGWAAGK